MTITEVLQLTDNLVFAQTGRHLDDLQEAIIKGVWQGKIYSVIADECNHSESRIRDVGYKLWKILSEQLGEDVNKSNFHCTFERFKNSRRLYQTTTSLQQVVNIGINSNINLYPNRAKLAHNISVDTDDQSKLPYHDLTLAPKITHFYGRETELQTLLHWLTDQNTPLISILGLPGIGKTTLVKRFIDLNLQNFDVVIWKNIKLSQSLDNIINEILIGINLAPIQTDNKLTQLFNLLREQKCLIIVDDLQELFTSGQFSGQYKSEYKDYQTLFTKMSEIEHQSSLILISQEQCQEMLCLDEDLYPVKCLELEGIGNTQILRNHGLKDEQDWSKLINLYEGNPVYIKNIASLIKNVFFGKVAEFLAEDSLIITADMKSRLSELFHRLSPIEQQIILELSKSHEPVSREDLRQSLELSSMDLINGLQSLNRRCLLKRMERDKILFNLSPVLREYLRNYS